ncbi:hypothetical protein VOLCADRAFT_108194 [Volvox carteri f. nagariensis]|uniref:Uncharacterized protein n=1 Tax=Volvox carteri f. nagariensis TaxID=3068 RepID=D8UIU7_VOLCA|nr:uncharacterized protein VOLCADRAFT_108194 [Volvox carteri f. nagariensis]EFJ40318.1 hypothetical protein VOLCADRAFT_108194 [Volvox carteri f. nagariensis]|eukprot:XP_002958581.1 hypothetical protein VOLCADRAFT_108194 [Volvox carteri f. nagariensis]
MAVEPNGSSSDIMSTSDYESDDSVTVQFSFYFFIVKCAAWWGLWLLACVYAMLRRKVVSRAWFIFTALLFIICCNGIQCSGYVAYASHVLKGHGQNGGPAGLLGYLVYLLFFNISRSMFLAVLLVIASGYCITRSELGPHKQHVVFVPTAVLVTGLITDYSFLALAQSRSSNTSDMSDLGQMDTLMASMWFVCAVLNLAALILAWLYLFEALSKEIAGLEADYKRRTGQLSEEAGAANPFTDAYTALGNGPGKTLSAKPAPSSAQDPESGEGDNQTVADHLAYTAKKKLLSRFSLGVSSYLVAEICVILLPLFINSIVQSTLQVLQFALYIFFMIVLLVIFRPQEQSSYLMIGFSEEDAEERGVSHLLTAITMESMGSTARDGDSAAPAPSTTVTVGAGPSTSAPRRASHKAEMDAERYRQIPSAPTSSTVAAGGNQLAPLPTSTQGLGSGSGAPGVAPSAVRGAKRGPQPRSRPLMTETAADSGQFTLCSDDEEGDEDASHPLTRGRAKGF